MPSTYLLLRNNKQTGPLSLEALLQHQLQPHDLIWVEGQSAGWQYPAEITALKPHLNPQKNSPAEHLDETAKPRENERQDIQVANRSVSLSKPLHIYVSLPAGTQPRTEEEPSPRDTLEQKAAALHQRIQAFAEGKVAADDADTHYTRSLEDMKQEYGTWLVKQRKKKKSGSAKRNLLIAASLLIVTMSGFGITRWIRSKPGISEPPPTERALGTLINADANQIATTSFSAVADSFSAAISEHSLVATDTVLKKAVLPKTNAKPAATKNIKASKQNSAVPVTGDTTTATVPVLAPETKEPVREEVKKVVPLSQLVVVNGIFQYDKKGNTITATQVKLQNNSNETLKSVAVAITYFKKEDRELKRELVYFYNVVPGSASVITASGNRRATSASFAIGTITRADGSLYLIH